MKLLHYCVRLLIFTTALLPAPRCRAQAVAAPVASKTGSAVGSNTGSPVAFNTGFRGDWAGTLEYRDYSATSPDAPHTFLPTWLTLTPAADGLGITFRYIYDDGPTKVVRSQVTWQLAPDGLTLTSTPADGKPADRYTVTGTAEFLKLGRGTLVLTGHELENGKPVDTRITMTLRRNLYTYRKETCPAGTANFAFRDAYSLTRATPPSL